MSHFIFLCNELVQLIRVQVLNTNRIPVDSDEHNCVCNALGATMKSGSKASDYSKLTWILTRKGSYVRAFYSSKQVKKI